jgi:DNA-directed RNA polymerase subunit RPC12/RpoP
MARKPRPARPTAPATEPAPRGERRRQGRPAAVAVEEEPSAAVEAAQAGEDTAEALWCPTCETHVPIADLDDDDACPTCGQRLGARRVPLKFKLMIAASVIYLGYRAYQGITWVAHHV